MKKICFVVVIVLAMFFVSSSANARALWVTGPIIRISADDLGSVSVMVYDEDRDRYYNYPLDSVEVNRMLALVLTAQTNNYKVHILRSEDDSFWETVELLSQ